MTHTVETFVSKMNDIDLTRFSKTLFNHEYNTANHSTHEDVLIIKNEYESEELLVFDTIPYKLFADPHKIYIDTPNLTSRVKKIYDDYGDNVRIRNGGMRKVYNLVHLIFVNNFQGFGSEYYTEYLLPQYKALVDKFWTKRGLNYAVASMDIFLSQEYYKKTVKLLKKYYKENYSICIELLDGKYQITECDFDNFTSGVGQTTLQPYPTVIRRKSDKIILHEFENLLNQNPSEAKLEMFLTEHFQTIFGEKYDRIETQISLNFPDLDISGGKRRIDLFLHDAQRDDWELMELKKLIPLGKMNNRSIPAFRNEVISAITQLKAYQRIFEQSVVKNKLSEDGIKYYQPSFTLIAGGGKPSNFTHEQWRWLVDNTEKSHNLKFLTYSDLLTEMKLRLSSHNEFLDDFS